MYYHGKARVPVREAILHCAAIKTGQFDGMPAFGVFSTINRWHTAERGFTNGFGYHGLIMPDGEFYSGRPFNMIGAHCIGKNAGSLGILLIERREINQISRFEDWFTDAQGKTLRRVLRDVPGLEKVSGHNDYAEKLCPGFRVETSEWL